MWNRTSLWRAWGVIACWVIVIVCSLVFTAIHPDPLSDNPTLVQVVCVTITFATLVAVPILSTIWAVVKIEGGRK